DDVTCRQFLVEDNIITEVAGTDTVRYRGNLIDQECAHLTGEDIDHDALTVQLYPFNNTPNRGGVYKVWVTLQSNYDADGDGSFGFIPRFSKTDNFKIKGNKPPITLRVRKFNDLNFNGCLDAGEPEIGVDEFIEEGGWPVDSCDPLGVENNGFTPWFTYAEPPGPWFIWEEELEGWLLTGAYCDGTPVSAYTLPICVTVAGTNGETHEVVFLNGELAGICAFKGYDADGDGPDGDTPVEGFQLCLTGTDILDNCVGPICKWTDSCGKACWSDLLPGTYEVCEVLCGDWEPSTDTCVDVCLESGEVEEVTFSNYCTGDALMHTKGWWQNPNGCEIVAAHPEYLDELNELAPYITGFVDAHGEDNCLGEACGDVYLPFNSPSELGCYIVAPNSQNGCLGLAQQLCAFVLNMLDQCGSMDVYLIDVGMSSEDIIDAAICAWQTGIDVGYWQTFIDELNNSGIVSYISDEPCPIVYDD
ncbi:MAG: hypothetical protein NTZ09_03590, partial [Candidatus Hydrogenedentes bacterium]|nr:hypothetical protein [Candidatus Hydrogenedentota bacterium]